MTRCFPVRLAGISKHSLVNRPVPGYHVTMPPGDPWTDLRHAEPPPVPRWRRIVKRLGLPVVFVVFVAYSESKQRVRDAVMLRDSSEVKALVSWAALKADSRSR